MNASQILRTAAPMLAIAAIISLTAGPALAERYRATLSPLNAAKIGTSASGTAVLVVEDGKLAVEIDAKGLPPSMMHLQHFHGFADNRQAACPAAAADTNGDGYIDLTETEPMSGTTMLPFHAHPASMEIPSDTYPMADAGGAAHYSHSDPVADLEKGLKEKFGTEELALPKRVIFIHGVAADANLPATVRSLPGVPAQVTIPIACGVIEADN